MQRSAVAARSHAQRLEVAGWLARHPITRGHGSHCGCAWVAASLTARGHEFLGPRELLEDRAWSGEITWRARRGYNSTTHRPDLIGAPDVNPVAIEVELTKKSAEPLRAIIGLHARWRAAGWTAGVIYICGDGDVQTRIVNAAKEYGLADPNSWLTTKPLDRIRTHTLQTYERQRAERASAGRRSTLPSDRT
jgi:hypothetical protein